MSTSTTNTTITNVSQALAVLGLERPCKLHKIYQAYEKFLLEHYEKQQTQLEYTDVDDLVRLEQINNAYDFLLRHSPDAKRQPQPRPNELPELENHEWLQFVSRPGFPRNPEYLMYVNVDEVLEMWQSGPPYSRPTAEFVRAGKREWEVKQAQKG